MPVFETETYVACSPEKAFDFLTKPANLALVSPPDLHLTLLDGPERLALGSQITVQGSKFGIRQKITSEVTAFDEGVSFTDTQIQGPFARFVHTHRVDVTPKGTRLSDHIEFEAPSGLIGMLLTNQRIRQDLEAVAAHRNKRFEELLGALS